MKATLILFFLSLTSALGAETKKIECYAKLDGPKDDPNNIYRCPKPEKCCQENGRPSCCREKDISVSAWEQAQLWGTLAGMILVLAAVMWYCRHDGDCFGNKKGQEGCCCCKRAEGPQNEDDIENVRMPPDAREAAPEEANYA
ncbi:uncharacterized protein [Panulirus ornatus]|uniref:uncharacterized protein n=1 Tax=Panulirus ornatus TaxID=150431 RepID=UPI003A8721BB